MSELRDKVVSATKWSAFAEVLAKLVSPISSMILARLLTPEAFGAVATISMIISFADLFTEIGFQKFLIHFDFSDQEDLNKSASVAFWVNLMISLLLWIVIIFFRNKIAILVGSPGLGNAIAIASCVIPLMSFSSIQMGLYKRSFDFKTLFSARLAVIIIPLFVTIPLAFVFKNYWALIVGNILVQFSNALVLTLKSKWKPILYFNIEKFKRMWSYCVWIFFESIMTWTTNYLDIFLVGTYLSQYYLGLYKTSMTTVNAMLSVVTSVLLPVMMSALSRVQNDSAMLRSLLLKFQRYTSFLLLPLGVGIFLYSDLVTKIFLGDQWVEANNFIGLWGLVSVFIIIFSRFCTIVFVAVGKTNYSLINQIVYLLIYIPALIVSVKFGYESVYLTRCGVRVFSLVACFILLYKTIRLSPTSMFKNVLPDIFSCVCVVFVFCFFDLQSENLFMSFVSLTGFALFYLTIQMLLFQSRRKMFLIVIGMLSSRLMKFLK